MKGRFVLSLLLIFLATSAMAQTLPHSILGNKHRDTDFSTAPTNGQMLKYNSTTGKWAPATFIVQAGSSNVLTYTGNYSLGLTLTGNTALTLPTSGTLATTGNLTSYRSISGSATAFTADDATPAVNASGVWFFKTANANPTTITDLDSGVQGQHVFIYIDDSNTTFDFTGTELFWSQGIDYVAADGDLIECVNVDGTNWRCSVWGSNAADGNRFLAMLNNTSRAPTASIMELYPEGNVWKANQNGTEFNIPMAGACTALASDGAATALTVGATNCYTLTVDDNEDQTITFSGAGYAGQEITIIFKTAGSADEVITFHATLVSSTGTLTLGTAADKYYVVRFISNGTHWFEVSRTAVQT